MKKIRFTIVASPVDKDKVLCTLNIYGNTKSFNDRICTERLSLSVDDSELLNLKKFLTFIEDTLHEAQPTAAEAMIKNRLDVMGFYEGTALEFSRSDTKAWLSYEIKTGEFENLLSDLFELKRKIKYYLHPVGMHSTLLTLWEIK